MRTSKRIRLWVLTSAFLLGMAMMLNIAPATAIAGSVPNNDSGGYTPGPSGTTQVKGIELYSVDNIQYQMYTNEGATTKAKQADGSEAIFTLGADGKVKNVPNRPNKTTVEMLPGTYYLQEVKGRATVGGSGYLAAGSKGIYWNPKIYKVVIESTDTENQPVKVLSVDDPVPITGTIDKIGDGDKYGTTVHGDASLAGAVFKVEYFPTLTSSPSGNAMRTWYFKTNDSGHIDITNSSYDFKPASDKVFNPDSTTDIYVGNHTATSHANAKFVSHTDWTSSTFFTKNNQRVFLLGTYRITEMAPPEGYTLSANRTQVVQVNEDGNHKFGVTFKDPPIKGSIRMRKTDSITGDLLNGDMKLDAEFTVYNISKKSIIYGDREVPTGTSATDNNKVGIFKAQAPANANGQWWATTLQNDWKLDYGTYLVKETKQATGHVPGTNGNPSDDTHVETVYLHGPQNVTIDCTHVWSNAPEYNGIRLLKVDWDEHFVGSADDAWGKITTGEGDASLLGAKFAIVNHSTNPVYTGPLHGNANAIATAVGTKNTGAGKTEWWTDPGETCLVIEVKKVTDRGLIVEIDQHYSRNRNLNSLSVALSERLDLNGAYADGVERLPYGRYSVKEIEPPSKGYLLNHTNEFWGPTQMYGNREWYYVDGINLDELITADHSDIIDYSNFDYEQGPMQP